MKPKTLIYATTFCTLIAACNSTAKEKKTTKLYEPKETITLDPIKRGEYLVNAVGCHDCHTPKKPTDRGMTLDTDRLLSGHPADETLGPYDQETTKSYVLFSMGQTTAIGPWGTSFASNLTPDDTGLGSWTEDQFLTAIKKGLYKGLEGSRPLLPPMPWETISKFSDEDLKAIFAYLKSIKPVENVVPSAIPPKAN
jgi:hypothetical protein